MSFSPIFFVLGLNSNDPNISTDGGHGVILREDGFFLLREDGTKFARE